MKDSAVDKRSEGELSVLRRTSIGAWIVIVVLSLLLVGAGLIAHLGWTLADANVTTSGYVAMGFGVIFSLVVGIGLMTLLFYSSRAGYDEPAVLIEEPRTDRHDFQKTSHENGS